MCFGGSLPLELGIFLLLIHDHLSNIDVQSSVEGVCQVAGRGLFLLFLLLPLVCQDLDVLDSFFGVIDLLLDHFGDGFAVRVSELEVWLSWDDLNSIFQLKW